jgi:nitrate reductase (cytochrome), electron transfer subunit
MKFFNNLTLSLMAATVVFFSGCSDASAKNEVVKPNITEASLGLRKTDLYTEHSTAADQTNYRKATAGGSAKINRAFQDAPPMIPHDTEGMLPIKIGNNQCTGCHMPEVANMMGATPIPVSHLTDFRPKHSLVGQDFKQSIDNMKNEVTIKKNIDGKLTGARFNCSQCHAPQSQGNLIVENTFEAAYTNKDGAFKSSWDESQYMDSILETVDGTKNGAKVTAKDVANKDSKAGQALGH